MSSFAFIGLLLLTYLVGLGFGFLVFGVDGQINGQ
jgi:hypothetical protein